MIPALPLTDDRSNAPLQRQRSSQLRKALQASIPKSSRLSVANDGDREGRALSCANDEGTLPHRVKWALRRRLHPNTALSRHDLARATDLSDRTIDKLLSGYSKPSADTLDTLRRFLGVGFIAEVFAAPGLEDLDARRRRAAAELMEKARQLLMTGTGE